MGNFNPNYFERKAGSLERAVLDAVNGVQSQINENQYYEYKFKNKNDAMKAKSMLDGIQLMNFDINDDNISNGELMVDAGKKNMSKYHNMIMKQFKPKVMAQEKLVGGQKKLDKDKDGDIDGKDFAMLRKSKKESVNEADDFKPHMMYDPKTGKGYEAKTMEDHLRMKKMGYDHEKPKMDESMKGFKVEFGKGNDAGMAVYKDKKDAEAFAKRQPKPIKITQIDVKNANMFDDPNPTRKEAYEIGTKEYANHTKKTTPGQFESQGEADWNETVVNIQKKQTSMREALAKVWGYNEGKSPFDKEENVKPKKEGKTLTGKPMTKIDVKPDMKEK